MADKRRTPAGTQPAFVLHAYDWSESSLILDLYTRDEGRVAAVAKGAKRPYSQLRAVLLPFQMVQVQLSRPRSEADDEEVRTLRTAEWSPGCPVLAPEHLLSAYYLNELLMKFLPRGQAQPVLFEGYRLTLSAMALGEEPTGGEVLRAFELLLLREAGLLPDLTQETLTGADLQPNAAYALKPEWGLVRVSAADGGPAGLAALDWIGLQAALNSGHLAALQAACGPARAVLRPMLRDLLTYHLEGAPLRTRDLLHALRRLGAAPILQGTSA